MQFTINSTTYELTREQVESTLAGAAPDEVSTYSVEVGGNRFPVKQVISEVTDLHRSEFTSGLAQRVLTGLGFLVLSTAPGARGRISGSTRSFDGVEWGLAASERGYEEASSGKPHLPGCAHGVTSPIRIWAQDEVLKAWGAAPDADLRTLTRPGWCSDCTAIRGTTDPGVPAERSETPERTGRAERTAIAQAGRVVLDGGLRRQASAFDGRTVTWTADTAATLRQAIEAPGSSGTFRADRRAADRSAEAVVLLAAELCFLRRLP